MNKHREVVYRKRLEVLMAKPDELRELTKGIVDQEIEMIVSFHTAGGQTASWDLKEMYDAVSMVLPIPDTQRLAVDQVLVDNDKQGNGLAGRERIIRHLSGVAEQTFVALEQSINDATLTTQVIRSVMLRAVDSLWIEHLDLMDHLREGIGLRGYGQREPLVEYKREAYSLFTQLINSINLQIATTIFKIGQMRTPEQTPMASHTIIKSAPAKTMSDEPTARPEDIASPSIGMPRLDKVGRNDPCPCGSGKKFKKCYLANDPACKLLKK